MIQTLRLQNFKAIKDVKIGLERLTVFVGPNGSGKTSLLQGLELIVGCRPNEQFHKFNKAIFIKEIRDKHSEHVDIMLSCSTSAGSVYLQIKPDLLGFTSSYSLRSFSDQQAISIKAKNYLAAIDQWEGFEKHPQVFSSLGKAKLFRFDPGEMAEPSSGVGNDLQPNGGKLASFLTVLALNQPDEFATIQQAFRELVPTIKRIRFDRSLDPIKPGMTVDEIIFDLHSGASISARAASEGTLLILGLLAALYNQNSKGPKLILLDDLDRGLHPLAQRNVIDLLRKVLDQKPDLQILATTHSPYLVDSLQPEEVRMTTLNDDGTVACGKLIDHPKFEKWKNEMAPGEMWSMFGEKWVRGYPVTEGCFFG